jgi:hypothetical protein
MTITPEAVSSALDPLRQGFQADGADLLVDAASAEAVTVRLVITDETCLECISPTPLLTQIVEAAVREDFPDVGRFALVDPRSA